MGIYLFGGVMGGLIGYRICTHTTQSDLEADDKGEEFFDSLVVGTALYLDTLSWRCDCCGLWIPPDPTETMPAVDTSVSYNVDVFIQDNRTKEHWMNAGVAIYQGSLLYVEGSTDHNGLAHFRLPEGSYQIFTRIKKGNAWGLLIDVSEDRCDTISISGWPKNLNHDSLETAVHPLAAYRPQYILPEISPPRTPIVTIDVGELVICERRGDTLIEMVPPDSSDTTDSWCKLRKYIYKPLTGEVEP